MKRYIHSAQDTNQHFKFRQTRQNRFETDQVIIWITKTNRKWNVSICDKNDHDLIESMTYNKKENVNNLAEKYGATIDFD